MKIKFMIHRSKKRFLEEKEYFRKMVGFYNAFYPDLKFIDRGIRFSIKKDNNIIDFDFGFYNMDKKDFKKYDYVISTGLFAIINSKIQPGDMILPIQTTYMHISQKRTKLVINSSIFKFNNQMNKVIAKLVKYEQELDTDAIKKYIYKSFKNLEKDKIHKIKTMHIHKNGKMITCNTTFMPSELIKTKVFVKDKEIPNLQKYLEKNIDGLNCETKGMIKNIGSKLLMLSWGLDKPYQLTEFTKELWDSKNYHKIIPTFNLSQKIYFYFLLLGYLIKNNFHIKK